MPLTQAEINAIGSDYSSVRRTVGDTILLKDTGNGPALHARAGGVWGEFQRDNARDVRSFGAVGDGVTDDTQAIQDAIDTAEAAGGGVVYLSAGTYLISTTLTVDAVGVVLRGEQRDNTEVVYSGSGTALDITSAGNTRVHDLKFSTTTGAVGVHQSYNAGTTGFQYVLADVVVDGFSTYGVHIANSEHGEFRRVVVQNCGTGFRVDNSAHTGSGNGVNNRFIQCRATGNTTNGWDVNNQGAAWFLSCQSFNSGGTYEFKLGGSTAGCRVLALNSERSVQGGTGLLLSGADNTATMHSNNLDVGVELIAATRGMVGQSKWTNVTTHVLVKATCTESIIHLTDEMAVTDSASDTTFIGSSGHTVRSLTVDSFTAPGGGQLGFFGATPVSQPSLPAAGTVTADDIRQALIDLGLCS